MSYLRKHLMAMQNEEPAIEVSVSTDQILQGDNFKHDGKTYRAYLRPPIGGLFVARLTDRGGEMVGHDVLFRAAA